MQSKSKRPFFPQPMQIHYGEIKQDDAVIADLFTKVQNGELDEFVRAVSDHHVALNIKNRDKQSLLHACINQNTILEVDTQKRLQIARYLLSAGVSVSVTDTYGVRPIHLAVKAQDPDLVRLFLEEGAEVNVADSMGMTPLHYAVTGLVHAYKNKHVSEFIGHESDKSHPNIEALKLFDLSSDVMNKDFPNLVKVIHALIDAQCERFLASDDGIKNITEALNTIRKTRVSDTKSSKDMLILQTQNELSSLRKKIETSVRDACEGLFNQDDSDESMIVQLTNKIATCWGGFINKAKELRKLLRDWGKEIDKVNEDLVNGPNNLDNLFYQINALFPPGHGLLGGAGKGDVDKNAASMRSDAQIKALKSGASWADINAEDEEYNSSGSTTPSSSGYKAAGSVASSSSGSSATSGSAPSSPSGSAPSAPSGSGSSAPSGSAPSSPSGSAPSSPSGSAPSSPSGSAPSGSRSRAPSSSGSSVASSSGYRAAGSSASSVSSGSIASSSIGSSIDEEEEKEDEEFKKLADYIKTRLPDLINTSNFIEGIIDILYSSFVDTSKPYDDEKITFLCDGVLKIPYLERLITGWAPENDSIPFTKLTDANIPEFIENIKNKGESAKGKLDRMDLNQMINCMNYYRNLANKDDAKEMKEKDKIVLEKCKFILENKQNKKLAKLKENMKSIEKEVTSKAEEIQEEIDQIRDDIKNIQDDINHNQEDINKIQSNIDDLYEEKKHSWGGWNKKDKDDFSADLADKNTEKKNKSEELQNNKIIKQGKNDEIKNLKTIQKKTENNYDEQIKIVNDIIKDNNNNRSEFDKLQKDCLEQLEKCSQAKVKLFETLDKLIQHFEDLRIHLVDRDSLYWIYHMYRSHTVMPRNDMNDKVASLSEGHWQIYIEHEADVNELLRIIHTVPEFIPGKDGKLQTPISKTTEADSDRWPKRSDEFTIKSGDVIDLKFISYKEKHILIDHLPSGNRLIPVPIDPKVVHFEDERKDKVEMYGGASDKVYVLPLLKKYGSLLHAVFVIILSEKVVQDYPVQVQSLGPKLSQISTADLIQYVVRYASESVIHEDLNQYLYHSIVVQMAIQVGEIQINVGDGETLYDKQNEKHTKIRDHLQEMLGIGHMQRDRTYRMQRPVRSRMDRMSAAIVSHISNASQVTLEGKVTKIGYLQNAYQGSSSNGIAPKDIDDDNESIELFETWTSGSMQRPLCRRYNAEITQLLLTARAYPMTRNMDGNTPLHLASENSNIEAVKILIDNGALANSVRSVNMKQQTPIKSLIRQLSDKLLLCRRETRAQTLHEFVLPLVRETYHSFERVEEYRNNLPDGIEMGIKIALLMWNHHMNQHTLTAIAEINRKSQKDFTQNDFNNAITELQQCPGKNLYNDTVPPALTHGLLGFKPKDSLDNTNDYNIAITNEINSLMKDKDNLQEKINKLTGRFKLYLSARNKVHYTSQEYNDASAQCKAVAIDGKRLEAQVFSIEKSLNKLNILKKSSKVATPYIKRLTESLGKFRNTAPSRTDLFHENLLRCFWISSGNYPMYKTYELMWQQYIDNGGLDGVENIGFSIIDYAHSIINPKQLPQPSLQQLFNGATHVAKLAEYSLLDLKMGIKAYWQDQPEAETLQRIITCAIRGTVGGNMYRALLHLLSDHISQNSSSQTVSEMAKANNPQPGQYASNPQTKFNKDTDDYAPPDIVVKNYNYSDMNLGQNINPGIIVEQIASMNIDTFTLHDFLLDYVLTAIIKKNLGLLENRYDPDAKFSLDSAYDSIKHRLSTNPYFPISSDSNLIEKLTSVFFPFWFAAIDATATAARTAIEGWQRYILTISRQLEMLPLMAQN
jgi:ankyrin repeat protein